MSYGLSDELIASNDKVEALRNYARSLLQALVDLDAGYPRHELGIDIGAEIERGAALGVELDEDDEDADG